MATPSAEKWGAAAAAVLRAAVSGGGRRRVGANVGRQAKDAACELQEDVSQSGCWMKLGDGTDGVKLFASRCTYANTPRLCVDWHADHCGAKIGSLRP